MRLRGERCPQQLSQQRLSVVRLPPGGGPASPTPAARARTRTAASAVLTGKLSGAAAADGSRGMHLCAHASFGHRAARWPPLHAQSRHSLVRWTAVCCAAGARQRLHVFHAPCDARKAVQRCYEDFRIILAACGGGNRWWPRCVWQQLPPGQLPSPPPPHPGPTCMRRRGNPDNRHTSSRVCEHGGAACRADPAKIGFFRGGCRHPLPPSYCQRSWTGLLADLQWGAGSSESDLLALL